MTGPSEHPAEVPVSEPASVLVCRGCCCGTTAKVPGVDHDGHLRRLREAVAGTEGAKLRTVDCLGPCELANVVVVRRGTRRWWFGEINEDVAIGALARWIADPAGDPPSELDALHIDRRRLPNRRQLAPEQGDDLVDWLATAMAHGTWTIGVPGAIAEFDTANVSIERHGLTVTATTGSGAMRLTVDERTRLFTFGRDDAPEEPWADLLVRSGPVADPHTAITEVGADHQAIDPARSGEVLFDLGLGRSVASFGVRTADPATLVVLRRCVGIPLDALPGDAFAEIVERSPTRVVTTALGRIEVRSPIPPPDGTSPQGAHTHLRPEHVEATDDWPAGFDVPSGWTSGAAHYPAGS